MDDVRLRWTGNVEAQKQADEAYAKLPDKPKKRHRSIESKRRRTRSKNKRQGRIQYREYMVSHKWKRKRKKAIAFHGAKCQTCGATGQLYVHHKHYKTLGRESMDDLEVLCLFCHEDRHPGKVLSTDPVSRQFREITA